LVHRTGKHPGLGPRKVEREAKPFCPSMYKRVNFDRQKKKSRGPGSKKKENL